MGDYGIKITKAGAGISSTNDRDYIFWSKYSLMKVFAVGTYSYTFPSDLTEVNIDITHNEGERKVFWLSISGPSAQDKTSGTWLDYVRNGGDKALRAWYGSGYNNKLNIHYIESNITGNGYDPTGELWEFKYYIFKETLS